MSSRSLKVTLAALLGTLGAGLSACPGNLENPDRFVTACDVPAVIEFYCAGSNCHSPDHEAAGTTLVLVDIDLKTLKDKDASYQGVHAADKARCPDPPEKIIDTHEPEQSLLIKKLNGDQACGLSMPYTGVKLRQESLECLLGWARTLAGATDAGVGGHGGGMPAAAGAGGMQSVSGASGI